MQENKFNWLYSEKEVLDEEIWRARESYFSLNYLPICYVNRTFVKLVKKQQTKQQRQQKHNKKQTTKPQKTPTLFNWCCYWTEW